MTNSNEKKDYNTGVSDGTKKLKRFFNYGTKKVLQ